VYDPETLEELPESEQGFETSIHGTSSHLYDDSVDAEYSFSIALEHNAQSVDEYMDVVYTNLVNTIEDEYSEADVISPEPAVVKHFFNSGENEFPN